MGALSLWMQEKPSKQEDLVCKDLDHDDHEQDDHDDQA